MSTVNISLPQEQISLIDKMISRYGFANRSEFFRSLVRLVSHKPEVIEQTVEFPFVSPNTRSVKKIISSMKKTGKYPMTFLKSLEQGLKDSDYFTD